MSDGVEFSIVIPAYNDVELLRKALESVRCQRGVVWEAIVTDDSDNNSDIERYVAGLNDERIVYRHNMPSRGAVSNWNCGLRLSQGGWVIMLHHDEMFSGDDYLLKLKEHTEGHDVLAADVVVRRTDGHTYRLAPTWMKRWLLRRPSLLMAVNVLGPCAVVSFRRDCLLEFDERLRWFVDVEWYYRMLRHRRRAHVPQAVVVSHHGHHGQISGNIDPMQEARKDAQVLYTKYKANVAVRLAVWLYISVIRNEAVRRLTKKILRR